VSRLAAASESASASGGSGLTAMGADSHKERCFLGRHCRRLRKRCATEGSRPAPRDPAARPLFPGHTRV